jgi:hypothetical protein
MLDEKAKEIYEEADRIGRIITHVILHTSGPILIDELVMAKDSINKIKSLTLQREISTVKSKVEPISRP